MINLKIKESQENSYNKKNDQQKLLAPVIARNKSEIFKAVAKEKLDGGLAFAKKGSMPSLIDPGNPSGVSNKPSSSE